MIEIISTKDGSHTLRNSELNETYHSIHGAVQESLHVFIKNGFDFFQETFPKQLSILEIGFGTGLNAWLTATRAIGLPVQIQYTTLESFPLEETIWSKLNYAANEQGIELFTKLHQAGWSKSVSVTPEFTLFKIHNTLQQVSLHPSAFDLVYFDAFAPEKQPEMWALPVLEKVISSMKPGAILVTYCAKGQLKRDLKSLGLTVEALPGPPGKREMIRAKKYP
ncbi:MAG: tRNA (5-methylaminomethyl-2-thiouridine)(34)-methyltransferase MnmD [Cyclobacteriaceae bacterium]|nr:tRNA (5-methylaminomethyl-2-thiouridine)(34)-methyltransferase MnmD [Cyclobacteriaceae bacterium]